jgi:hypothetical protein
MSNVMVLENDLERAKARFITAYNRGMKETAAEALFLSGKGMSGAEIGALVGHGKDWANKLIVWARGGFNATPFNPPNKRRGEFHGIHSPLKNKENFGVEDEEEDEVIKAGGDPIENACWFIDRMLENTRVIRKVVKQTPPDEDERRKLFDKLGELISKWQSLQRLLG